AQWYLTQYPDVRESSVDPYDHFVRHGASEGRNPNAFFDTSWYLANNPDVHESGMNPLDHYLRYGAAEGRKPAPMNYGQRSDALALKSTEPKISSSAEAGARGLPIDRFSIESFLRHQERVTIGNAIEKQARYDPTRPAIICAGLPVFSF